MPPVQTDFNVTLEAPEKPQAGETMQERAFFFHQQDACTDTRQRDRFVQMLSRPRTTLHTFLTTPTCLRKASHEAIELSLRRWPLLLLCQGRKLCLPRGVEPA